MLKINSSAMEKILNVFNHLGCRATESIDLSFIATKFNIANTGATTNEMVVARSTIARMLLKK